MREFECKRTDACGNLCKALQAQGVDAFADDDTCTMPEALNQATNDSTVEVSGRPKNIKITERLMGALRSELTDQTPGSTEVNELIDYHGKILDRHTDLWEAMIRAAKVGRHFTDVESCYYQEQRVDAEQQYREYGEHVTPDTIVTAQAGFDNSTLRQFGIVFDEQSIEVLDILAGNYLDGKPTLLVGDKGIAKTKLARFMGKLASDGKEPIFISGKGDQMSDEFMGRYVQDTETGNFVFSEGKAVEAMRQGKPLIIDEINLADQAITMRLQDILLRKPGESIALTESGDREVTIAPGFTVFATANEASERYKHRVTLDPAFRDRFEVVRFNYPDSNNAKPLQKIPVTLMRLALAAICDEHGAPSKHIDLTTLEEFVRLSHVTQKLYSTPLTDSGVAGLAETTTDYLIGDKPVMSDCITPRTMIDTLLRCADGNKPGVDLRIKIDALIDNLDQAGTKNNSMWAYKAQKLLRNEAADSVKNLRDR